jgi:hypothetical protein
MPVRTSDFESYKEIETYVDSTRQYQLRDLVDIHLILLHHVINIYHRNMIEQGRT